jgi:hypothetical protein
VSDTIATALATVVIVILLALLAAALARWLSADRAAEALLREMLTPAEYRQLRTTGYLEVASPTRPGRVYRVPRIRGKVVILEDGHPTELLCLQPAAAAGDIPDADIVLMHKVLIQSDEEYYLTTANHFRDLLWWLSGPAHTGPGIWGNWP